MGVRVCGVDSGTGGGDTQELRREARGQRGGGAKCSDPQLHPFSKLHFSSLPIVKQELRKQSS